MDHVGTARTDISLMERVRALEDRLALMDLEAEYAVAWDQCDAERWAAVFTDDGVFSMPGVGGRASARIAGRDGLRAFCAETTRRWTGLHFMHNPKLTIDGDTARGIVLFEYKYVMRADTDQTIQATASGHYDVTYVRTDKGWRMKERIDQTVLSSSTSFYEV